MVQPALLALTPSGEPIAPSAGRLMSMPKEGSAASAPSISAKAAEWGDKRKKYLAACWKLRRVRQSDWRQLRVAISSISVTRTGEVRS
jgi:hypothetical protein